MCARAPHDVATHAAADWLQLFTTTYVARRGGNTATENIPKGFRIRSLETHTPLWWKTGSSRKNERRRSPKTAIAEALVKN